MKKFIVSFIVVAVAASLFMVLTDYQFPQKDDASVTSYEPITPPYNPGLEEDSKEPVDVTNGVTNNDSPSDETSGIDVLDVEDDALVIEYFGEVTIQVIDEFGDMVINQNLGYFEGDDDLIALMKTELTVYCGDAQYNLDETCETRSLFGRTLLGIDDVVSDWTNSFIAIYVNDVYSTQGIDGIELVDGDVIRFVYTSLG